MLISWGKKVITTETNMYNSVTIHLIKELLSETFLSNMSLLIVSVGVCIFVALSVWMFVAGANKVEGTMR